MTNVLALIQSETVQMDSAVLDDLILGLRGRSAEDVLCRAIEDMGLRLSRIEPVWRSGNWTMLRKNARALGAIAGQAGMKDLVLVAGNVVDTIDAGDLPAVGATVFRLLRVGEKSLTAMCEVQDIRV